MTEKVKKAKAPAKPRKTAAKKETVTRPANPIRPSHDEIERLARTIGNSVATRMAMRSRTGCEPNGNCSKWLPNGLILNSDAFSGLLTGADDDCVLLHCL